MGYRNRLDSTSQIRLALTLCLVIPTLCSANEPDLSDLLALSLEELMQVEISSSATLTDTKQRLVPAAVTTITREQIQASAARSLFELLDIYVPNLQWIRHHWESDHLGMRGIMNDRDDKYLLLVNGRIMNERTHYGAMSERDLVLLNDIHHIDVIRGPGSTLYGPGAVSMVINLITDNADTFQGHEITTRMGAIEEFYSLEYKYGRQFPEQDTGLFLYTGIGKYHGASQYDAPQVYAVDFPTQSVYSWDLSATGPDTPGEGYPSGGSFKEYAINNDGEDHRHLPPVKIHAQVKKGNWDLWTRYTRGGKQYTWDVGPLIHHPWGWGDWIYTGLVDQSSAYQQATIYLGHTHPLSDQTSVQLGLSFDMFDFERINQTSISDHFREDEYLAKALVSHSFNDQHKLALGIEGSHERFGKKSPGYPDEPPRSGLLGSNMPSWHSETLAAFGEYQATLSDQVTCFFDLRVDDHTYTRAMFSPRFAAIYTPDNANTWKLIWARSVRANFAEEMKAQAMDPNTSEFSTPEKLSSVELRYERVHTDNLLLAASAFLHYELELISHSGGQNVPVGRQKEWGIELEATYQADKARLSFSHGFTKLLDFDLIDGRTTLTTAEPYGYGKDLANWSNHVTKLVAQYPFNDQWKMDGSLRIYWGFPGTKHMQDYDSVRGGDINYPVIESNWKKATRGNYYLNLGLQYQPNEQLTLRLDGYNLLGLFEKDLNKRNYYDGFGSYRSHAAALGLYAVYHTK